MISKAITDQAKQELYAEDLRRQIDAEKVRILQRFKRYVVIHPHPGLAA